MSPVARVVTALALAAAVGAGLWFVLRDSEPPPRDSRPASVTESSPQTEPPKAVEVEFPESPGGSGPGVVHGRVVTAADQGASGALVRLQRIDWKLHEEPPSELLERSTTAAGDARFRFTGIPTATYVVTARDESSGGLRVAAAVVTLTDAEPSSRVTLTLQDGGTISGRVEDSAGSPVAGALVFPGAAMGRPDEPRIRLAQRGVSGADGTFTIGPLADGEQALIARAAGYATAVTASVSTGRDDVVITLGTGAVISGRVVSADGVAVDDVTVVLHGQVFSERQERKVGDDGTFAFRDLRDAEYSLGVDDARRVVVDGSLPVSIRSAQSVEGLTLSIAVGAVVRGRVFVKETGEGIAGAVIHLYMSGLRRGSGKTATTNEAGDYVLEGLAGGSGSLYRGKTPEFGVGQGSDNVLFDVALGEELTGCDFAIDAGLTIAGRVIDGDAKRVAGARIQGRDETYRWYQIEADENGRFRLRGLQPTPSFVLNAQSRGLALPPQAPFPLQEDIFDLELVMAPEASISGVVIDSAGNPLPDMWVDAAHVESQFSAPSARSDAEGHFRIGGLAGGRYRLMARQPTMQVWRQNESEPIEVAESETVTGVEVVWGAADGLVISGRVTDERGDPIEGATINASGRLGGGYARTGGDGEYEIYGLEKGSYRLGVSHALYASAQRDSVRTDTTGVDFELVPRGAISGRVVSFDGRPVTSFRMAVLSGNRTRIEPWQRNQFRRMHDDDGRFRLPNVEPGNVTLAVEAPGFAETTHFVGGVESGETVTDVLIELTEGIDVSGIVVDSSGHAIEGAEIFLGPVPDPWMRAQSVATRSDASGRFLLIGVGGSVSRISATHPSYASGHAPFSARNVPRQLRIELTAGGVLEGTITVEGVPSATVNVHVYYPGGESKNAHTKADGSYRISGLPPGVAQFTVNLQAGGNQRMRSGSVKIEGAEPQIVDVDFPVADATVEGRVLLSDEDPTTVSLNLMIGEPESRETRHTNVDEEGYFRFAGVPSGPALLVVHIRGGRVEMRQRTFELEVAPGTVTRHDVDLLAGASISGRIEGVGDAKNVFAAVLKGTLDFEKLTPEVFMTLERSVAAAIQIGEDGEYAITGLETGEYTVLAIAFDKPPESPEDLADARFASANITLDESEEGRLSFSIPPK